MNSVLRGWLLGIAALTSAALLLACPPKNYDYEHSERDCAPGEVGILADSNHIVVGTKPGSAAEAAGVRAGDRLVSLNGARFADQRDAVLMVLHELSPCEASNMMTLEASTNAAGQQNAAPRIITGELVVSRDGSELSFTVDLANEPDVQYGKSGYTGPGDPWGATHTPLPPDAYYVY